MHNAYKIKRHQECLTAVCMIPVQVSEKLVPVKASQSGPAAREPVEAANTGSGWAVLQDELVGVAGTGTKLKDWDKAIESEEDDGVAGEREGVSSSDEEPEW